MIFTFSQGLSHSTNTSSMNVSFAISNARYIFTGTFTSALVERRKWIIDSFMAIAGQYGCQLNFFFYRYLYVKKFVSLYCNITVELGPPWYYMIGYTSSFVCYYAFFIVGTVCVCICEAVRCYPRVVYFHKLYYSKRYSAVCEMYTQTNMRYIALFQIKHH